MDIGKQVLKMSTYLAEDAIARALNMPVQTVEDILRGDAQITELEPQRGHSTPQIQVHSTRTAWRQKVISIWRGKGGVGTSVLAAHLAYLLKDTMSVLLMDLNLARGGSDLAYYMEMPEYPHIGMLNKGGLLNAMVNYDKNFYILQPPQQPEELKPIKDISGLIAACRQEFDAIVIDLPNEETEVVKEAVKCSTTLVMVLGAFRREIYRVVERARLFANKDIVVVTSNCSMDTCAVKEVFGTRKVVAIPYDPDLDDVLEGRTFSKTKSIFFNGVEELKKVVFEERKSLLKRLVGS